jgi:septal ring factor EnvC (AmiA/AmiB activator)
MCRGISRSDNAFCYTPAFIFRNTKERREIMDDIKVLLEGHEQRIRTLERDVKELQDIRSELKVMSESLVELTTEMKHTNEHLVRNEKKIDLIENQPKMRMQQIITAIISALAGVIISATIGNFFG